MVGFFLGCIAASAVTWLYVIPQARESYRAVGFHDGRISAQWEIADQIEKKLGSDLLANELREAFYDVKASSVVVVERNGVKTLRLRR